MRRTLGLDIGTNSIGWAVLDVPDTDDEAGAVLGMGSRIFQAGAEVKGKTVTTKARERREKRAMRRQIERRARRRRLLRTELTRIGLLPTDPTEFDALMDQDPNVLIEQGLAGHRLEPAQIGRVIYWMSSKRGFLSLRSGGSNLIDDDADFVPNRYRVSQFSPDTGERLVTGQEDRLVEFLKAQRQHHPELGTDQFLFGSRGRLTYPVRPIARSDFGSDGSALDEFGVHGLVFFQRKVYWKQSTIGTCSLDPESGPRAARAERLAQDFAVWNTIVNLRVGAEQRGLDEQERQVLHKLLSNQQSVSFSKVRKALGLGAEDRINFDRGERDGLIGNQTDALLANRLKDTWKRLSETDKDRLVYLLIGNAPEDQLRSQLASQFDLDTTEIDNLLKVTLPSGRANYSRATIRKLLDHVPTADTLRAAIASAGYTTPEQARAQRSGDTSMVTNPLVRTSLTQLDKVLAELQWRFARADQPTFDVVRIELSRDVSANAKQRERATKANRDSERARQQAQKLISEWSPGSENSRTAIRKARLWATQQQRCLYCGKPISPADLFSNNYQIDHILPQAQTLDDSMSNLAVVHTDENLAKGDRTVFEWAGEQRCAEIVALAKDLKLPFGTIRKLETEHVDPDVIPASLLVQTGYINSLARDHVAHRPGLTNSVEISRGRLTAALLYRIGLKKNGSDHRRHAQDAAMVAITTTRLAQNLAKRFKSQRDRGIDRNDEWGSWEPWPGFRTSLLDNYEAILVSHRPTRKSSGQLHEETYYGKVQSPKGTDVYARRRGVFGTQWTPKMLSEVADPVVRHALEDNLRRRGLDPASTSKLAFDPADPPTMPDGNPIRKARCHLNAPGNRILRPATAPKTGVSLANNHIAFVYENIETGKLRIEVVTRLDSFVVRGESAEAQRLRYQQDGERFLYSLCAGDTIAVAIPYEGESHFLIRSLDRDSSRFFVEPIRGAERDAKQTRFTANGSKSLRSLGASKVTVSPTGLLRTNNE